MKFNLSISRAATMKTVSILRFRKEAKAILRFVEKGQSVVLTYRGKPVARLEPIAKKLPKGRDDPFYALASLASDTDTPKTLTNSQIDQILYGG